VYRIGAADRDHADPHAIELTATIGATALIPLAPVHLRGKRQPGGIEISWIRRTRRGGDNWELAEVPLAEEREAYRVEILGGSAVLRRFEVTAPAALYLDAHELADFGAPQSSLSVRVAQLSAAVGAGHPAQATLSLI
jgi:hypothetical protein